MMFHESWHVCCFSLRFPSRFPLFCFVCRHWIPCLKRQTRRCILKVLLDFQFSFFLAIHVSNRKKFFSFFVVANKSSIALPCEVRNKTNLTLTLSLLFVVISMLYPSLAYTLEAQGMLLYISLPN